RRHDVRVMDARREARLVEEHPDELTVLGEVRVQPLHRDDAAEALLAEEARHVHTRHPAMCDRGAEDVAPEPQRALLAPFVEHLANIAVVPSISPPGRPADTLCEMPTDRDERTRSHVWEEASPHPRVLVFWPGGYTERVLSPGSRFLVGR